MNFISKAFSFILRNVEPQWGQDYRGIGGGVDLGPTSQPVGLQQDAMGYGLGADPRRFYQGQDQLHPAPQGGQDAMAGIYYDSQPGTLRQEDMYLGPEGNEDLEFDLSNVYPGPYNNPFQPGSRPYDYVLGEPFEGNPFQPASEEPE